MEIKATEIVQVKTSELIPYEKNMNKHTPEQIDRLIKLIEYQGFRDALIVQKGTNIIAAGHGRWEAAKKMGLEKVPVTYQEFENEAQFYAFVVSHNAIAKDSWASLDLAQVNMEMLDLGPDFDIDMLGIKDFVIEPIEKFEAQSDEDEVPEVKHAITRRGDIWLLGNHRVMCGDSTMVDDVEKLMSGEKADMVFTDPPYGVDVVKSGMVGAEFGVAKKGEYKAIIGDNTTDAAQEFYQACRSLGFKNYIIWGGNYFTDFLEPSKSWVIWNKRGDTNIQNTFADGEMAWSSLGHPVRIHGQLWNGMIRSGEKDKRVHPTQKPIALAEFCFNLLKECQSVFDGFLGSGSTLIACEKTSRKCYGMELDEHYCDVIINRWEKYSGKKATLELTGQTYEELKAERDLTRETN